VVEVQIFEKEFLGLFTFLIFDILQNIGYLDIFGFDRLVK